MDELTDKRDKVPSSNRRNNKPLMEKRRRQRINECLNQLKSLVLQAMKKDTTQYSKLEKADILEMTVKHLKMVQRQQVTAAMASDPNVISKYRAGFNECAAEISRYLDTVNGGSPDLKMRVMNYLANSMMQFPVIPVYQGMVPPHHIQMTSQMTSQQGLMQQMAHRGVPIMSGGVFLREQDLLQNQTTQASTMADSSQHQLRVPVSLNIDTTSYSALQSRCIPSPCDSDSGLSDSSTSMSHDENGNYSNYNSNHHSTIKAEPEARLSVPKCETTYSPSENIVLKKSSENGNDVMCSKRTRTDENCPRTREMFNSQRDIYERNHQISSSAHDRGSRTRENIMISPDVRERLEPMDMVLRPGVQESDAMWRPW